MDGGGLKDSPIQINLCIRKVIRKLNIFLGLCPKLWMGGGQES